MKDSADDESGPIDDPSGDHQVPRDAEWEMVVQEPVEEDRPGGLTTTIVYAVAEVEGIRPVDVTEPPLFDVIDTAALEAAYFGTDGVSRSMDGHSTTEFMYRGHRVVVRSDGWVCVFERADE